MDTRTPPTSPWRPGRWGPTDHRILLYRRFDRGLKNAIFAFQPPWYKFEMRCPLVRPSQTHLRRSARAPTDRGTWGLGEGVLGSNRAPTTW